MRRLFLALLAASSVLQASSVAFSTCTAAGQTLSPCSSSNLLTDGIFDSNGNLLAAAYASASPSIPSDIGGPGSLFARVPGGQDESAQANAYSVLDGATAMANAAEEDTYRSAGPARAGFIQFVVQLDELHGGNASALLTDGGHTYSYSSDGSGTTPAAFCNLDGCAWQNTEPFQLGSTFEISAFAKDIGVFQASGSDAKIEFRLLEADGATPVSFSMVPEPEEGGLLALALAGFACLRRRKPR